MRPLALLLAGLLLLAACGGARTRADMDKDGRLVADQLKALDASATFSLTETLTFTGGDIPKGKEALLEVTASGWIKDDDVQMTYKLAQGSQSLNFDMVLAEGGLFVRDRGGSAWRSIPEAAATFWYPSVRLQLIREAVLLARSVDAPTLANTSSGFLHKYVVKPAKDQLEQLQAVSPVGQAETAFLKSASGEIDAFLSLQGGKLTRLEVHLGGVEPDTGEHYKVDSTATFKAARPKAVSPPAGATPVSPSQIFTGP